MGYYRLLLAMLVLASHIWYRGFDYGQSAVVCFFIISGFVMTKLLDAHYSDIKQTTLFYVDRAARIFPQYFFYCIATLALITITKIDNDWTSACTPAMLAGNFSLYMLYDPGSNPIWKCTLIPPAWSLSLEWAFYLVVPFIANSRSKAIFLCVAVYSLATYIKAYLGIIDTDWNGFRHLPGTLFMFLVGVCLARDGVFWKAYGALVWVGAVVLFALLFFRSDLYVLHSNKEILVGIIAGIPALYFCIRSKSGRLEGLAGNLSYGVFLNHYLVILIVQRFMSLDHLHIWMRLLLISSISLPLSYATFTYIERPVMNWRRTLRARKESTNHADAIPT